MKVSDLINRLNALARVSGFDTATVFIGAFNAAYTITDASIEVDDEGISFIFLRGVATNDNAGLQGQTLKPFGL